MALEKNKTDTWKHVFNISDYFWHRNKGSDHIFIMPAPVTNFRHESSRRGFFHYMIQLHTPIFIHLEYSKAFIKEYPICSSYKNILVPYPSIDPKIINGNIYSITNSNINNKINHYNMNNNISILSNHTLLHREILMYYIGGNHGECMEVRKHLNHIMKYTQIKIPMNHRQKGYLKSIFCPVPVGDSPSSKRMYDALVLGCIPVILSDDLVWAFSPLTNGIFNPLNYSITLPQKVLLYFYYYIMIECINYSMFYNY
jgi:hypothetical protein